VATVYDPRSGRQDLWVYEMARGLGTRFTFDDSEDTGGLWSPDGETLAFASNRNGRFAIYRKAVAGTSEEELVFEQERDTFPTSWHPEAPVLALSQRGEESGFDITLLPLTDGGEAQPFLMTSFNEYGAVFSPDGRWIAYGSNESGDFHVYVQPYPGPGRKWQVSTEPGAWPLWSPGGREILYQGVDGTVLSTPIEVQGENLVVGATQPLFRTAPLSDDYRFAVSADAERFLVFEPAERAEGASEPPPLSVMVNWPATLERD
jgi:Tol biopolymer transport system component